MDICYSGIDLPRAALPPAAIPDFFFAPQQQDAAVQEYIDRQKDAAAAAKSQEAMAAYAALASDVKRISVLYGSLRQEQSHQDPYSSSKLTAGGHHSCTDSNSSSRTTTLDGQVQYAAAATAANNDDVVVLCEELIDTYGSESCSPFSGSCYSTCSSVHMDMADDLENREQQKQLHSGSASNTPAAMQEPAALQLLTKVASHRKGYAALTHASSKLAGSSAAAMAMTGSHSVKARLLITEVSVYYCDMETHKSWDNSPLALAQANHLLSTMTLPESVEYMPVTSDSWLFQAAASFQFPSFVVCLGSSYMQRLFATLPQLAEAAAAVPEFQCYCKYLPAEAQPLKPSQALTGHQLAVTKATLRSLQFTCLFLALKVADRVHALGLLRFILTQVSYNKQTVSHDTAADIESQCLEALGWRLGPWFGETELSGNDEEMWAAAMGRWEYGTNMDSWEQ